MTERIDRREHIFKIAMVPVILLFMAGIFGFVCLTGGIKYVFSHAMYIPIIMAGFIYGSRGGIVAGIVGGIVLGPFMPIDTATGEMQTTVNWLVRCGIFVSIGFIVGVTTDRVRNYITHLKWLSKHDTHTRLSNRNALLEILSGITGKQLSESEHLLIVVRIENVTEIKSAFGIAAVEEGMIQASSRVADLLHQDMTLFRIDTAELAILAVLDGREEESLVAELVEIFRHAVLFNTIPVHLDARLGYVKIDRAGVDPEQYIHQAEIALADASEKALDSVAFTHQVNSVSSEDLFVIGELRDAISAGQLSLHYQPKIDIATGKVDGAEALMRWNHPEKGNIPPGLFIPRAEQSTLIQLITAFALEQAVMQMVRWKGAGLNINTAVNISTRNILQPGFSDLVFYLLEHNHLDGKSLELEVTEGTLMMDVEKTANELRRFSSAKITISIDDFGTGYSSLQYLHSLPVSLIKIDRSFVMKLPDDSQSRSIVETVILLAHRMGFRVIAEGVENRAAYEYLGNSGCDMVQGYLVSPPMPAGQFSAWYAGCGGRYELSGSRP